ncbi:MAG TPA: sugar phosphate isomerase/epimerase [Candidatus Acidoferrales bacterium]|nr:sugar phosphate isomerase/epimerase [Candidatus Acidoferrales bacterium]
MKKHLAYLTVAACGLWLSGAATFAAPIPDDCKTGGFAVGCQAWTFNHYTVMEAIDKTAEAGGKVIEFYPGQKFSTEQPDLKFDHNATDEMIAAVQARLKKDGIRAVNYGVVGIPNNEAEARKIFDFAKKLDLYGVTTESVESIDIIEKLVKEYDLHVGFHDHPRRPDDPSYKMWDPNYVLSVVKDRDARIGACADTGHWVRSGLDPVDCLKILKGRIMSSHLKDLNEKAADAHDVPYGTGVSDIPAILQELRRQHFAGNISIEYEYDWTTSLPEVSQCVGFVRGYGAAEDWNKP